MLPDADIIIGDGFQNMSGISLNTNHGYLMCTDEPVLSSLSSCRLASLISRDIVRESKSSSSPYELARVTTISDDPTVIARP